MWITQRAAVGTQRRARRWLFRWRLGGIASRCCSRLIWRVAGHYGMLFPFDVPVPRARSRWNTSSEKGRNMGLLYAGNERGRIYERRNHQCIHFEAKDAE
jgi:hypothetical protein